MVHSAVRPRTPSIARQSTLRDHNVGVVLQAIAQRGPLSRADLSQYTGLTRATVSRLVQELLDAHFAVEDPIPDSTGPGRPATPLRLSPTRFAGVGVEINVDYLAGRALALDGTVLGEFKEPGSFRGSDPADALALLAQRTEQLLDSLTNFTITGVVLGIPGLVDTPTGTLLLAPNLRWNRVVPAQFMARDVQLLNDANLQGRAAATLQPGRLRSLSSFLYMSGDIGVGAAIVTEGRTALGRHGWAGEIGHVCVEPDGPLCGCGNRGCLEQYAGINAILQAAHLPPNGSYELLLGALERREPAALAALERAGWALGIAISDAVNLLDIPDIVLGTNLAPLLPWLHDPIVAQLTRRPLASPLAHYTVNPAPPDTMPCSTGGALTALDVALQHPAAFLS